MKLPSAIVGEQAGPFEHEVDARWLMAYSAALGETDARYFDTGAKGGVLAHPLFPVCYEWPVSQPIRHIPALREHFPRLVHAEHDLVIHRAPRRGDRLKTRVRIVSAQSRRPGAYVVFRFETGDASGAPVTTTDFGALYRGVSVEGGDRALEEVADPAPAEARFAEYSKIDVPVTAAHVYTECARIWNPIHTDIAYARAAGLPAIILHGTATLALSVSLVLKKLGEDPRNVRRVQCRFSGMVPMPAALTVHAGREGGRIGFEARNERGEAVIARASVSL